MALLGLGTRLEPGPVFAQGRDLLAERAELLAQPVALCVGRLEVGVGGIDSLGVQ
jgi:hypothetical protein